MPKTRKKNTKQDRTPTIENRRARHDYHIDRTIECGIKLTGTEVKAIREGKASLKEGYVRVQAENPPSLWLHSVHIAEYNHAAKAFNHNTTRTRLLLAHKREINQLAKETAIKGVTIVPLKLFFKGPYAKLQIGVARGKKQHDKRQDIKQREHQRDIERALSKKMKF
jgi:SsrA-binding protein